MLEFKKRVLTGVSFDPALFEKELMKALKWLMPNEVDELKSWCYKAFGNRYHLVMDRCFSIEAV